MHFDAAVRGGYAGAPVVRNIVAICMLAKRSGILYTNPEHAEGLAPYACSKAQQVCTK